MERIANSDVQVISIFVTHSVKLASFAFINIGKRRGVQLLRSAEYFACLQSFSFGDFAIVVAF